MVIRLQPSALSRRKGSFYRLLRRKPEALAEVGGSDRGRVPSSLLAGTLRGRSAFVSSYHPSVRSFPDGRFAFVSLAVAVLFVACGARTGLDIPGPVPADAAGPLVEGGPLDVSVECATPTYCDPSDLGYVWKCGARTVQCSSLEQCEERESGATCVNP